MSLTIHESLKSVSIALLVATTAVLLVSTPVHAGKVYDEDRATNPLRIVTYVLHPIGAVVETVVFKPLAFIGSKIAPVDSVRVDYNPGCQQERPNRACTDILD